MSHLDKNANRIDHGLANAEFIYVVASQGKMADAMGLF
jgi:hypothetical protein